MDLLKLTDILNTKQTEESGMNVNDLILKFVLMYLTDENLRKVINPYKVEFVAKLEAAAKATPEVYDDVLVKILKVVLGV